jgi:hypothetical protein
VLEGIGQHDHEDSILHVAAGVAARIGLKWQQVGIHPRHPELDTPAAPRKRFPGITTTTNAITTNIANAITTATNASTNATTTLNTPLSGLELLSQTR